MLFYCQNLGGVMSENESYGLRVEKKIDNMQNDIHTLSNHVARLTFINEAYKETSEQNRKEIDALDIKVLALDKKSASQDGGISMLRYLLGACGGVILAACFWVGSSIIQLSKDTSLLNEKLTRLETDVQNYRGYK